MYGSDEIVLDLDGNVLEGNMNRKKAKLLEAWVEIHRNELYADWKLIHDGQNSYKIDPLK